MKKLFILSISFGVITACSSNPKSDNHKINCDKMHLDSQTKLNELQRIFNAYQDINVDLATRISQPYKEEVAMLDSRISKQKAKCWKDEERPIDADMASLKDDVYKIYGEADFKPVKKRGRVTASLPKAEPAPVANPVEPAPVAPVADSDSDVDASTPIE